MGFVSLEQLQHPIIRNNQKDMREPMLKKFEKGISKYNITQKHKLKKICLSKVDNSMQNEISRGPAKAKRFDMMTSIISNLNRKVDISIKDSSIQENSS
jgi:alpha-glucuronidase